MVHRKMTVDVILCTRYVHQFPFLADDLKLNTINILLVLYNGVAFIDNPKCIYVSWHAKPVFLLFLCLICKLSMFVTSFWVESSYLPRKTCWLTLTEEQSLADIHSIIEYQEKYCQTLADLTNYPKFDISVANKQFFDWVAWSPVTETKSVPARKPWI